MNQVIDRRFERLDKALATLITSISTYNPSITNANDLVAADAELSQGLEQLSTHQSNHGKILSLRATSQELDTQIRETLTLLTSTRAELLSTPATTFPTNANTVAYSELLEYARRISKFTLPSTYRQSNGEVGTGADTGDATSTNTPKESKSETQTNGTGTPVTVANGIDTQTSAGTAMDIDSSATPAAGIQQPSQNMSSSANILPPNWEQYVNPPPDIFVPWPTEYTIRRGALASIQMLIDQGKDPATFDPAHSAALEEERKRQIEEEDRLREEEQLRMEEQRRQEMARRMSVSQGAPAANAQRKQSVFQLETFDDEEDD
ncbi:vitamin-D-receptor interacting mediator subunit 4-domain-containing protein [Tricladium varicosporioides]|nr:vitamin-D-receptor interacting mediator subunit 4-domain-containing protein [Hymenoscyphus varicosporioides]